MKALVLTAYDQLSYTEVLTPDLGHDEVLIAVKACGICGSDVHGMDGSTGRRRPPVIMGHEAAGIIAAAGDAVRGWKEGDRVTFDSTIYCGTCDHCRRGEINLCNRRTVLGVSCEEYRRHGAMAEFVAVPQHILYRMPPELSFEHAAMVEPFSIALHAVRRSPPNLNDTAVVIGAGMIGLALVQSLRRAGCGQVVCVDIADDRLGLAAELGSTHTINSQRADALKEIKALTDQQGAALAFEAVGVRATVGLAFESVRKGATVTLVGNVSPTVDFPLQAAVTRELTIRGSCASSGEYPAVLAMMARGSLNPAPLISKVVPLEQGADWFRRLHAAEPGLLKIILAPESKPRSEQGRPTAIEPLQI